MNSESVKFENKDSIQICEPQERDVLGLTEVFYKSWLDTYPDAEVGVTKEDVESWYEGAFTPEKLEARWKRIQEDKEGKTYIAKEDEKIVGVSYVHQTSEANQLHAIYVLPEYLGKGIGYKLWTTAQEWFDPKKKTIVQVATYNDRAINFYKKLGFIDTGKRWKDEKFKMKSGAIIEQLEMERPADVL